MSLMANPIEILNSLQQALNDKVSFEFIELESNYKFAYDEPNGGRRFSFAKIVNNEVQAIAIFGLEEPLDGLICYSVGYAVGEKYRGRGLALEAIKFSLEKLILALKSEGIDKFYLEAMIDKGNIPSINVAKKLFHSLGSPSFDGESGTPSFHFKKIYST